MPKDSGKPSKGKHGVPDKQAHKVGQSWGTEKKPSPNPQPKHRRLPGHVQED